ncbi:type IV toxin-antitoxin system AbiEi family antitoxin domain-containing protein [Pseudonocardia sp. CA-142604]|uniref:type IV toxin-antitoxin system AbiEi family antitoxin domain-containing protein n=1 Tax=Pseudonocardia sp. CA-142604 TaxID=3240024 RepID=UPI003D8E08E5
MDALVPGLNLRSRLLADGVTDRELRRLRRTGALATVRPGAYVYGDVATDAVARHRPAVHATASQLGAGAVVSHVSAAVLHGLPLWFPRSQPTPLGRVHATRDRRSGARRNSLVHLHAAALEPDEVVMVDGLLVTSVARTVTDLARFLPFESALIVADGALHRGLVTPAALLEGIERGAHRRGNTAARRVVAFADGRAESVGETRSRLAIHRAGLPPPTLQHEVRSAGGRRLGRTDFYWEEFTTVGEFDGRVKYGRLLRPGQEPGDAVFDEKVREDAMRAEGLGMARWTWPELQAFGPVSDRIRRAFVHG